MRTAPFPTRSAPVTLGAMSRCTVASTLLVLGVLACGMRAETGPLPARAPTPLDSMPLASDVRVDSAGRLVGSLVGEGTGTAVTLLSSDTLLIRALATRFQPELTRGEGDLWSNLRRQDSVPLGRSSAVARAMVGSPLGHTDVSLSALLLRGNRCIDDTRGARLE
ncbi:MAG: hypothetical protein ACAI18_04530, partial [Gemmatimonadales bacterium]